MPISVLSFLLTLTLSVFSPATKGASTPEVITVAVMIDNGKQRAAMNSLADNFMAENPHITIDLRPEKNGDLKATLANALENGSGPAIFHWQAGERLYQYARKGQIRQLNDIWQSNSLDTTFSQASVAAVTMNGHPYAIPFSYYQWGFYYRKSLFEEFDLEPPANWDEFMRLSDKLKAKNITPIAIGNKHKWPAAAWFDYFNLRINGLSFHSELLRGKISFTDQRVISVFEHWQQLLQKGYFLRFHHSLDWNDAMPFLYHKLAGMTLIGNFYTAQIPDILRSDIGFFKFPDIKLTNKRYEEAPTDTFIVPQYAEYTPGIEAFLTFVSRSDIQDQYNSATNLISPNIQVSPSEDYFVNKGTEMLKQAQGVSQYFDRDTNENMSAAANELFSTFIQRQDINQVTLGLEAARQQHMNIN